MDAKSFMIGVLVGVAGFAIVDRLTQTEPERQDAEVSSATASPAFSGDAPLPQAGLSAPAGTRTFSSAADTGAPADPVIARESAPAEKSPETSTARQRGMQEPGDTGASPREFEEDWPQGFIGSDPRTGAAAAAEAKDVSWSYQAEQLLTQYLATHPPAAHFEIRSIDCRTTFCQVRAVSSHPDAWPLWTQISHDISRQAWSEFGPSGSSVGKTTTGRDALILHLVRNSRAR